MKSDDPKGDLACAPAAQSKEQDTALETARALARRQDRAGSVLLKAINLAGGQMEDVLSTLPNQVRGPLEEAIKAGLTRSYGAAARTRGGPFRSDRAHRTLATLSGALGGVGGLPTAIAEMPVAITLIFRAVQAVAEAHGEDPISDEVRVECLRVFGMGGPGEVDDGIDTAFVGARLTLTGPALQRLIAAIAPRVAAVLGQKLAAGAVPLLGAAAGAGTNYAFIDYYVEIAHVHFGLRALQRSADADAVLAAFHDELRSAKPPIRRA